MSEGKEMHPGREDFAKWLEEAPPVFQFVIPFEGSGSNPSEVTIYSGGPHTEGGVTLHWHDFVINEWAEWYSDLGTALVRAACLARSCDNDWDLFFNDGPEGFVRWSENLFNQALTKPRLPAPPAG